MITLSIPAALDVSIMVLRAGMSTSQPSKPKRFSDDHFLARKSSNLDIKNVPMYSSWICEGYCSVQKIIIGTKLQWFKEPVLIDLLYFRT